MVIVAAKQKQDVVADVVQGAAPGCDDAGDKGSG